jgi:hypothetical protein
MIITTRLGLIMTSNDYPYWTYEEYAEAAYYQDYTSQPVSDTIDADDMMYPPAEYWDEAIAYGG